MWASGATKVLIVYIFHEKLVSCSESSPFPHIQELYTLPIAPAVVLKILALTKMHALILNGVDASE